MLREELSRPQQLSMRLPQPADAFAALTATALLCAGPQGLTLPAYAADNAGQARSVLRHAITT